MLAAASLLALVQGLYFVVTGVWPLVHVRSFMAVTGPKRDVWLVKTVGLTVAVIGATLLSAGWNERVTPEVAGLAVGSAAALAGVDVWYAARRVIPRIYLADAAAEGMLIVAWLIVLAAGA